MCEYEDLLTSCKHERRCTNHRLCPPCANRPESARHRQALRYPSSCPPCNGTDRPC
ncbi:hypothetical protein BC835DRAFT_1312806 [Cytidiella melzeri]|nr:hypothetical protein BC835DRAFT_1312806 [Cytidiella melzeri]